MAKTMSKEAQILLWNFFNEQTCKLHDAAVELHNKGAHSIANRKEDLIDELDDIARELGIID